MGYNYLLMLKPLELRVDETRIPKLGKGKFEYYSAFGAQATRQAQALAQKECPLQDYFLRVEGTLNRWRNSYNCISAATEFGQVTKYQVATHQQTLQELAGVYKEGLERRAELTNAGLQNEGFTLLQFLWAQLMYANEAFGKRRLWIFKPKVWGQAR